MNIIEEIRMQIARKRYKQKDISELTGIPVATISRALKDCSGTKYKTIEAIAKVLKMEITIIHNNR